MGATPELDYDALVRSLPPEVQDLADSLVLVRELPLTPRQLWGAALCTALVSRNELVTAAVHTEARRHLIDDEVAAARGVSATMTMNNLYGRFSHVVSDERYHASMPRLRASALATRVVPPLDLEVWILAICVVFGCGRCLDGHEAKARQQGATHDTVMDVARLAAVVHAAAVTVEAIEALP